MLSTDAAAERWFQYLNGGERKLQGPRDRFQLAQELLADPLGFQLAALPGTGVDLSREAQLLHAWQTREQLEDIRRMLAQHLGQRVAPLASFGQSAQESGAGAGADTGTGATPLRAEQNEEVPAPPLTHDEDDEVSEDPTASAGYHYYVSESDLERAYRERQRQEAAKLGSERF